MIPLSSAYSTGLLTLYSGLVYRLSSDSFATKAVREKLRAIAGCAILVTLGRRLRCAVRKTLTDREIISEIRRSEETEIPFLLPSGSAFRYGFGLYRRMPGSSTAGVTGETGGLSPLSHAVKSGSLSLVRSLVQQGALSQSVELSPWRPLELRS